MGWSAELLVAATGEELVGVAAVAWVPGGFRVLLHVQEGWRCKGVGRRLIAAVAASAAGETASLRPWSPLQEDDVAVSFLQAVGFRTTQRLLVFETDAARFGAAMTALLGRLAARMPAGLGLVTLEAAPADSLIRLLSEHFHQLPHHAASLVMPGMPHGYDRNLSLVLMRDGAAVGAMLCQSKPDHLLVDVNLVIPALRQGPANLMLLEAMARRARAAGVTTFRFSCEEHVRDTIGLARRSGARRLPALLSMALPCSVLQD